MKAATIALCLALSSCVSLDKSDGFIQSTLPQACAALQSAYVGFQAYAALAEVKQSVLKKVDVAYGGLTTVCQNPSQASTFDVIIRVTAATAVIVNARKGA